MSLHLTQTRCIGDHKENLWMSDCQSLWYNIFEYAPDQIKGHTTWEKIPHCIRWYMEQWVPC